MTAIQTAPIDKDELVQLYYDKQLSMQQIAEHFKCSQNKIRYWMEQYCLVRRNLSEATYAYRNPEGDPFWVKLPETVDEWALFGLGLGLYMGEGAKTGKVIALANMNVGIHRIFLSFLEKICGVKRTEIRASLQAYTDCNVEGATLWWATNLGLSLEQFHAPYVHEGKPGTYTKKSANGTLTIKFCNTKLKQQIDDWCSEYYSRYSIQ